MITGDLIWQDGRASYGAGALSVERCDFCRAPFTIPTPASHVHNVRFGPDGSGDVTPHKVWCAVR